MPDHLTVHLAALIQVIIVSVIRDEMRSEMICSLQRETVHAVWLGTDLLQEFHSGAAQL